MKSNTQRRILLVVVIILFCSGIILPLAWSYLSHNSSYGPKGAYIGISRVDLHSLKGPPDLSSEKDKWDGWISSSEANLGSMFIIRRYMVAKYNDENVCTSIDYVAID